jgi:hypothetical protein
VVARASRRRRGAPGVRRIGSLSRLRTWSRRTLNRFASFNLLQVATTVAVALLLATAALLSSTAAGEWQSSVRTETKRSAAVVENVRELYDNEAPPALEISLGELRARQLRDGARAARQSWAASDREARVEERIAWQLRTAADGSTLLGSADYRLPGGGYDVPRRLRDLGNEHAALLALDPDDTKAHGDRADAVARVVLLAALLSVITYLAIASRRARRRRIANESEPVGLIPDPSHADSRQRWATLVGLLAWTTATILPVPQILASNQEQRAQAGAEDTAVRLGASIQASSAADSFRGQGHRAVAAIVLRSSAVALDALSGPGADPTDGAVAVAASDSAGEADMHALVERMGRPPAAADRVDGLTRELVNATPSDLRLLLSRQNAEADKAQHAGSRSNRLVIAVLLAALALTLAGLASVERTATAARGGAALLLAISWLLAASAMTA